MKDAIYLDYAAATPVDETVLSAMMPYFSEQFHNPSSVYLASRDVKAVLDDARAEVAHWLGSRPSEVVFTAGATEANNLALNLVDDGMAIVSSIEHEAILEPAAQHPHVIVGVDQRGMLDLEELESAIDANTQLVSIMYANNEIGTVQHISDIAQLIANERDRRRGAGEKRPIWFHTDASQAANYLDLHVDKLGVDLMTISAGKIYGPKQVAALYVRAGIVVKPLLLGGGQERGIRSGTENVSGAVGLAAALKKSQKMRKDENYRLHGLSSKLIAGITDTFDDAKVLGHKKHRLPNIVSCTIPGIDGERVVMMLDEHGFQIATGSACSAMSDESSHVVKALGRNETEAQSTLRISMGRNTTEEDIDKFLEVLPRVISEARSLNA